jgi:hypothetical protein
MSENMRGDLSPVKPVTVTIGGVTHHGTYYVQHSLMYVQSALGTKATPIGVSPPEAIAKIVLSELVRAGASTD